MKNFVPILKRNRLFAGISSTELDIALTTLDARLREYKRGAYVLKEGQEIVDLLILVEGELHIQREDLWGNRSILDEISIGEMFGEAFAAPDSGPILNDVVAAEKSYVVFINFQKLLSSNGSCNTFHNIVVRNLLFAISEKNKRLVRKLTHLSQRSIREKLISYLTEQAKKSNGAQFSIPYNRQELADFLSVDRSALSNELCKMRREGLLDFNKNYFKLIVKRD